ncbi:acyltransferase-like protein 1 [Dermatophagoides farinae]|uniref:Acyltransferase-like protein 1 n=1 Tax=Dermatophagoides farinae TaxID=6954 RepID=A0A9D4P3Z2_DERFA|nr:acyltransferase-like protein 1 [Dermatophagoides farinae]
MKVKKFAVINSAIIEKFLWHYHHYHHPENEFFDHDDKIKSPCPLWLTIMVITVKPLHGLASIFIKLQYELSQPCNDALIHWFNSLRDQHLWAFRMLDSNGLIPHLGILSGPISNFGAYDQCLAIKSGEIRGQYYENDDLFMKHSSSNDTIWMEIQRNRRLLPAARWYLSVCLPSQCTRKDVQYLIDDQKLLAEVKNCHHLDDGNLPKNNVIFLTIFIIILIIILFTIIDRRYVNRSNNVGENKSINQINQPPSKDRIESIIDSVRLVNIILIIYWHTYMFTWKSSIRLSMELFQTFLQLSPIQLMIIGWPLMESMLFLEALRLSYQMFRSSKQSDKKNFQNIFQHFFYHFIQRWFNIVILLFWMFTFIPILSNGPQSFRSVEALNECRNEWWKILLFASNFSDHQNSCLSHIWIIAVEFQLFIIILPFIYIIKRMKMSRKTDFMEDLFAMNISPLFHLCSYILGLLFGYWISIKSNQNNNNKWPNLTRRSKAMMVAIILAISIVIGWFLLFHQSSHWSPMISSIILGSYRFIWSMWLIILFIFICDFNAILEYCSEKSNLIHMISPLAFQSYLIHYLVIIVRDSQRRQPIVFGHMKMFEEFLLNLFISLLLACSIRYFVSEPSCRIIRYCWKTMAKVNSEKKSKWPSKLSIKSSSRSSSYQEMANIVDNNTNDNHHHTANNSNETIIDPASISTSVELTALLSSSSSSSNSNGKNMSQN